jgi:ribonuclease D
VAGSSFQLHRGDLPEDLDLGTVVAVDTETLGLSLVRDPLCLVQLSAGDGVCHLVQFPPDSRHPGGYRAPRLAALLTDPRVLKIFHFARFDIGMLWRHLGALTAPVYCTKIASRLARTYTDRHGLKDLCRDLLSLDLPKEQQSTDWGAETLSEEQLRYAASDVLHLHRLREMLDTILDREQRRGLAEACFRFLPHRAQLDAAGWSELDIFAH